MISKLERTYLRTAGEFLLSRFILLGGHVDNLHALVSKVDWQMHEINCWLEMKDLIKEMQREEVVDKLPQCNWTS